jgi:hypothetical protein
MEEIKMKGIMTTIGSVAVVCMFSATAFGQAVAVKPRVAPGVKAGEAVQVAPRANPAVAARTNPTAQAANDNAKSPTCSIDGYASDLSKDTPVSFATAEAELKAGIITQGNCEAANYNADARTVLLQTGECALNKGAAQMAVGSEARDTAEATCFLDVKAKRGQVINLADAKAAVKKFKTVCNLIQ